MQSIRLAEKLIWRKLRKTSRSPARAKLYLAKLAQNRGISGSVKTLFGEACAKPRNLRLGQNFIWRSLRKTAESPARSKLYLAKLAQNRGMYASVKTLFGRSLKKKLYLEISLNVFSLIFYFITIMSISFIFC